MDVEPVRFSERQTPVEGPPADAQNGHDFTCQESRALRSGPVAHRGDETGEGPGASLIRERKRVLVVDDNVGSAESLALIIGLWGHDSRVAFNGPEALDSAHHYQPDVILLDLGLPGMDGFTVARKLREDPRFQATPLLAMTGYQDADDDQLARDSGIDRIFLKPINLPELESNLARPIPGGPSA